MSDLRVCMHEGTPACVLACMFTCMYDCDVLQLYVLRCSVTDCSVSYGSVRHCNVLEGIVM